MQCTPSDWILAQLVFVNDERRRWWCCYTTWQKIYGLDVGLKGSKACLLHIIIFSLQSSRNESMTASRDLPRFICISLSTYISSPTQGPRSSSSSMNICTQSSKTWIRTRNMVACLLACLLALRETRDGEKRRRSHRSIISPLTWR